MEVRIDFHTHIIPETFPDFEEKFGGGRWPIVHVVQVLWLEGKIFVM